ncbi:hypothetical protein GCK32_004109 [Trichostrongylus colubriformis]|uniref:Uncharacterized protein n=1 Tax=Trichostrongylus colubriformis TaxID=6319 RepID=A0AAN8FPG0_TRICO
MPAVRYDDWSDECHISGRLYSGWRASVPTTVLQENRHMENVLDIENIFGGRGFVASSSDDDEEVAQLSKAKSNLSSRLASLFAEDSSICNPTSAPMDSNTNSRTRKQEGVTLSTIFSTAVFLYLHDNGQFVSKGRAGMAVVRSATSDILIFYNPSKEAILCVPLGENKIAKIEKRQKYCVVSSTSKTFSFICLNGNDEAKVIAILMILCAIESTVLEEGGDDEVKMGSSILCDSTTFTFDGSTIEALHERDSKFRLTTKSNPRVLLLIGMKRNGKCMESADELTLQHRMALIGQPVLPILDIHANTNVTHSEHRLCSPPSKTGEPSCNSRDDPENSTVATSHCLEVSDISCVADNGKKVSDDNTVLHRIVGLEIDRLEIRLEAAMERMVERCFQAVTEEIRNVKDVQRTILDKLEELSKTED